MLTNTCALAKFTHIIMKNNNTHVCAGNATITGVKLLTPSNLNVIDRSVLMLAFIICHIS